MWFITLLLTLIIIGAVLFGLIAKVDGTPIFSWMLEQLR